MNEQQIIMNFSCPPSADDLLVMASEVLEGLPEELLEHCEKLTVRVDEIADEVLERDMELEDAYELLVLYKSGKELSPGVETKTANDDDVLIVFRRAVLDMWCETGEDLLGVLRQVIIEEVGQNFEFSEDDIDDMTKRHFQGMF